MSALSQAVPVMVEQATLARLQEIIGDTKAEIVAADVKAAGLLGWSGTMFALVTGFLAANPAPSGLVFRASAVIGVLALGGCVIALVLTVRPRLSGPGGRTPVDRSFLHVADLDLADLVDLATQDACPQVDPGPVAGRARHLARIARRKHRYVRVATTLLLIAMPSLALAASAGLLA